MAAAQAQQLVRERARSARVDELLDLLGKYEEHQPLTAKDEFGKLPLHHAAEANPHVGSVKLLIDRNNAALSEKCDLEMLPIHWACKHNTNIRVIELLIDRGGEKLLNARDIMEMLPVHHAAHRNANHEVIKCLVDKGGAAMLAEPDAMGMLPIHLAEGNTKEAFGALDAAAPKTLVTHGSPTRHSEVGSKHILSPQQRAIQQVWTGSAEQVRETIAELSPTTGEEQRDLGPATVFSTADEHGMLPLHCAVQHNTDADAVRLVIDQSGGRQALITPIGQGMLPIHLAARFNPSVDVIKVVIEQGGEESLRVRDAHGQLPIHHAAMNNSSVDVVQELAVTGGLGLLRIRDVQQKLPLQLAARHNKSPKVLDFLAQPFELKKACEQLQMEQEARQFTELHSAIECCTIDALPFSDSDRELRDAWYRDAIVTQRDGRPMALHRAVRIGDAHIVNHLLSRYTKAEKRRILNLQDTSSGYSALHMSVCFGRADIADEIIASGCDTSLHSRRGETAWDLATALCACHVMKAVNDVFVRWATHGHAELTIEQRRRNDRDVLPQRLCDDVELGTERLHRWRLNPFDNWRKVLEPAQAITPISIGEGPAYAVHDLFPPIRIGPLQYERVLVKVKPATRAGADVSVSKPKSNDADYEMESEVKRLSLLTRRADCPENIVKVLGIIRGEYKPFKMGWMVAYECCDFDLSEVVIGGKRESRRWSKKLMLKQAEGIAAGMCYLHHRQMLHLDLRLQHVLLQKTGETIVPKVSGLRSKAAGQNDILHSMYNAPEAMGRSGSSKCGSVVFDPEDPCFGATDIFAFGILMWVMWTRTECWIEGPSKALHGDDGGDMHHTRLRENRRPMGHLGTPPKQTLSQDTQALVEAIREGRRPALGENFPPLLKLLLTACWADQQSDRPSFRQIHSLLRCIDSSTWLDTQVQSADTQASPKLAQALYVGTELVEPDPYPNPKPAPEPEPEPGVEPEAKPEAGAELEEPKQSSTRQLSLEQVRRMVRIQLQIDRRNPNVKDAWIDKLFYEFDADKSGYMDNAEWEKLVEVLGTRMEEGQPPETAKHQLLQMLDRAEYGRRVEHEKTDRERMDMQKKLEMELQDERTRIEVRWSTALRLARAAEHHVARRFRVRRVLRNCLRDWVRHNTTHTRHSPAEPPRAVEAADSEHMYKSTLFDVSVSFSQLERMLDDEMKIVREASAVQREVLMRVLKLDDFLLSSTEHQKGVTLNMKVEEQVAKFDSTAYDVLEPECDHVYQIRGAQAQAAALQSVLAQQCPLLEALDTVASHAEMMHMEKARRIKEVIDAASEAKQQHAAALTKLQDEHAAALKAKDEETALVSAKMQEEHAAVLRAKVEEASVAATLMQTEHAAVLKAKEEEINAAAAAATRMREEHTATLKVKDEEAVLAAAAADEALKDANQAAVVLDAEAKARFASGIKQLSTAAQARVKEVQDAAAQAAFAAAEELAECEQRSEKMREEHAAALKDANEAAIVADAEAKARFALGIKELSAAAQVRVKEVQGAAARAASATFKVKDEEAAQAAAAAAEQLVECERKTEKMREEHAATLKVKDEEAALAATEATKLQAHHAAELAANEEQKAGAAAQELAECERKFEKMREEHAAALKVKDEEAALVLSKYQVAATVAEQVAEFARTIEKMRTEHAAALRAKDEEAAFALSKLQQEHSAAKYEIKIQDDNSAASTAKVEVQDEAEEKGAIVTVENVPQRKKPAVLPQEQDSAVDEDEPEPRPEVETVPPTNRRPSRADHLHPAVVVQPDYSELVEVQYGGKGDFQRVLLEITHVGEMVLYSDKEKSEEIQRATLSSCVFADPKKKRKGHDHIVRLDFAEDTVTGEHKYIVSTGTQPDLDMLKAFLQVHGENGANGGAGNAAKKNKKKQAGSQKKSQGPKSTSTKKQGKR